MRTSERMPILFLERIDLVDWKSEIDFEEIKVADFKAYVYPLVLMAHKVIFLDGENEKVLKDTQR